MILIRRVGGDGREDWLFDGWFLRPTYDRCDSLIFDGVELIAYDLDITRRWRFDGTNIRQSGSADAIWIVDGDEMRRPLASHHEWLFNGTVLVQSGGDRPDRWEASSEVPILVMCFAASIL